MIGPEVADAKALNIPLDQAEILVPNKAVEGRALKEFRHEDFAGQLQLVRLERGGEPIPLGADTHLQRFDVLFVTGLKDAVNKRREALGKVARPSTSTDLLTLSVGMVLGLLIGQINVPVGASPSASAMPAACCSPASSSPRSCRACASSAARRTPRATSSRISAS